MFGSSLRMVYFLMGLRFGVCTYFLIYTALESRARTLRYEMNQPAIYQSQVRMSNLVFGWWWWHWICFYFFNFKIFLFHWQHLNGCTRATIWSFKHANGLVCLALAMNSWCDAFDIEKLKTQFKSIQLLWIVHTFCRTCINLHSRLKSC